MPITRPTLRRRLYTLLAQWFVLFFIVAATVTGVSFSRFRANALDERMLLARTVAHYLDATLATTFQTLRHLPTELPTLDASAASRLRAFRFQSPFRDATYILDERAEPVVADPPSAPPLPRAQLHDREAVTPLFYRTDPGERPALAIIQPFQRDARRFFLVAEMNPMGSTLSTFLQSLAAQRDLHVVIIDANGVVIAAPDQRQLFHVMADREVIGDRIRAHRPFVTESGACTFCDQRQARHRFLTVMMPLGFAPWGVVVQQDTRRAFATLTGAQYAFLAAAAVLIAMGFALARTLSKSVAGPIRALATQAERLRAGDLSTPIAVRGDHETEVLAATMDEARKRLATTLGALETLNQDLERQVASRTRVLETQYAQRKILVQRLLDAGEAERRRIARELHDEISQLLTLIQLSLEDMEPASAEVARAKDLLLKTQKEVHRIIYDLRPSLLDDLGLPAAVKWYATNYLGEQGLQVSLEVEEELRVPPEIEIATFRIYQEIVTNILRHARAEHVAIELYASGDRLVLAVEDDGVGFAARGAPAGAGIVGMRERAELVNGTLTIDSEPAMGTRVQLEVPLT